MELDKAIKSRKSVRKYKSKKPDWRDIIECIDCCRYAPMAGNHFSLKFILIDDKKTIQKFSDCCQQNFVSTAHYVIVVCTVPDLTINCFEDFGEKFLRQQAGASIQNLLLKIHEKGLSACWVGYFVEEMIKRELNIPDKVTIEAILPIGYAHPAETKKQKRKVMLDNVLYFHKYGNKKMKPPRKLNV